MFKMIGIYIYFLNILIIVICVIVFFLFLSIFSIRFNSFDCFETLIDQSYKRRCVRRFFFFSNDIG